MSGSKNITLDDACEFIVDCLHHTAPIQEEGFPSIRTPNIGKGRLLLAGVNRVSEETYRIWTQRAVPEPGDLILAREAPAGNVAIIKEGEKVCLGQRTVHLRPNPKIVDADFLCYFLLAPPQQGKLLAAETGATAKHVNMRDIRRLELSNLPDLNSQRAAGAMLGAYDDLIENNRRRMALLEESARLLYREWFIRLRFPGYEHTPVVDGIPKGWERRTAFDSMHVLSGGTPKTTMPDYWDGEIPFFTPKDAIDSIWISACERSVTELGLKNCNSKLYPRETVFITARGTVGKLNMAQAPMAMSQSCYALVGKDHISQRYVYLAMGAGVDALRQQAVGAVFDAIVVDTFKRIKLMAPPASMLRLFDEAVAPIFTQVENLASQNQKLRAARDLLLPQLMSGELSV